MQGLIEWAIVASLTLIRHEMKEHWECIEAQKFTLNALMMKVEAFDHGGVDSVIVTRLKVDIVGMKKEMDVLISTNLLILFGTIKTYDVKSTDVPPNFKIPPDMTSNVAIEMVDSEFEV